MDVFNDKGLLNPGFSEYKLEEVEKIFVKSCLESQTRKNIYNGFLIWLRQLLDICLPNEIWIDGSFATNKINPNDVDLVYFIEIEDYMKNKTNIDQLRQLGLQNNCDTYIAFSPNSLLPDELNVEFINKRNYWRGQFGFDREDNPKGIIKINKDSLILFLKEVIKDA